MLVKIILFPLFIFLTPLAMAQKDDCEKLLTLSPLQKIQDLNRQVIGRLGPFADPFVAQGAFDPQSAFQLMDSLSVERNAKTGETQMSIVGKVRRYIVAEAAQAKLDSLTAEVVNFTEALLTSDNPSRGGLYRARIALELLLPHLFRSEHPEPVDRDGKPIEKSEDSKKESPGSKNEQQTKQCQICELPKDYDPFTKDTEKPPGPKSTPFVHAKFYGETAYFKQRNFNWVSRHSSPGTFQSTPLPLLPLDLQNSFGVTKKMQLTIPPENLGAPFSLFLPAGFVPARQQSPDFELLKLNDGSYQVTALKPDVVIELVEEVLPLNPLMSELLSAKVGVAEQEWPEILQKELFPLLAKQTPLRAAQLVESFIRNRYLYSVDAKPETDPIAALNRGAFQCDMAALIMVAILRDHLKIPSRAVGGMRANVDKQKNSLLIFPGEAHAWVEVFFNDKIHTFDPTPQTKDRKTKENNSAGPPNAQKEFDDETFPPPPRPESDNSPSDSENHDSDSSNDQSTESGTKPQSDDNQEDGTPGQHSKQDSTTADAEKKPNNSSSEPLTEAEKASIANQLLRELSVGSLSLQSDKNNLPPSALLERAVRVIFRDLMSPENDTSYAHKLMATLKVDLKFRLPQFKDLFLTGEQATQFRQEAMVPALLLLSAEVLHADVSRSYKKLLQFVDRLEFFNKLYDIPKRPRELTEALELLYQAQSEFLKIARPDGLEIEVARKFLNELPPHTRQIVQEQFRITQVDQSPGTKDLFAAIRNPNMLESIKMIRQLYPLTNFVMDSTPTPAFQLATTLEESKRSKAMPQYLPQQSLNGARQALRGQPQRSVIENLLEGSLYRKTLLREVPVAAPGGQTDPYRVTIALYDTSGSMSGEPGDFQAALMAAFVDRALSERGPSGQPRHVAQLMGFDTTVHTTIPVRNSAEAKAVITDYRQKLSNTSGGTDIQEALRQAFAAILEAQKRAGEPLASANIILMTDGQSPVDLQEVLRWRAAIDRKTPIKIMFVAINGSNPQLRELTETLQAAGVGEGLYREFSGSAIDEELTKSREIPKVDRKRDFYSDKKASALDPRITDLLDRAAEKIRRVNGIYASQNRTFDNRYWQIKLSAISNRHSTQSDERYQSSVQALKNFVAVSNIFTNARTTAIVRDDLLQNHRELTSYPLEDLDLLQIGNLKNLLELLDGKLKTSR